MPLLMYGRSPLFVRGCNYILASFECILSGYALDWCETLELPSNRYCNTARPPETERGSH